MSAARDLSDLLDLRAIEELKYAYVRCLDQKLWDDMSELFLPDATAAYSGGGYSYEGREAILDFLRESMSRPAFHSSHRMHHPEITLGGDEATGVWAMDDVVVDTELDFMLTGAGFYDDRYRRVGGVWRIAHTGYRRTFETFTSLSGNGTRLTASWWSTGGRSELAGG